MTITEKNMKRRSLSRDIRRQLATESIFALVNLRQTGKAPTHEDSPLLMCIWQRVRDGALKRGAEAHIYRGDVGLALRITVSALWDEQKRLSRFMVYDAGRGSLLLVGDMNGPVFPVAAVQTATENHPQTNESATS